MIEYATFSLVMDLKLRQTLCWSVHIIPFRDKFQSLHESVLLGSLKSFFQLDHQVELASISQKTTALYRSKKLVGLLQPCVFLIP
jgi:hypothetical protein